MKTRTWILLFSVVFVLCGVLTLLLVNRSGSGYAQVYSAGVLVRTVDLSQDTTFTVEHDGGYNVLQVSDGSICVTQASCPDGTCIRCGRRCSGLSIICLPNRLEIRFSAPGSVDAAAG